MADKIKLISTASHRYGTRQLVPGDSFEASPTDARLLKAIKRAKDAGAETPPQPGPGKNLYKRRDMKAEGE